MSKLILKTKQIFCVLAICAAGFIPGNSALAHPHDTETNLSGVWSFNSQVRTTYGADVNIKQNQDRVQAFWASSFGTCNEGEMFFEGKIMDGKILGNKYDCGIPQPENLDVVIMDSGEQLSIKKRSNGNNYTWETLYNKK